MFLCFATYGLTSYAGKTYGPRILEQLFGFFSWFFYRNLPEVFLTSLCTTCFTVRSLLMHLKVFIRGLIHIKYYLLSLLVGLMRFCFESSI